MSKFKIEKGASRINRVKLQASIEEPVATELHCRRMARFRLIRNR